MKRKNGNKINESIAQTIINNYVCGTNTINLSNKFNVLSRRQLVCSQRHKMAEKNLRSLLAR